MKPTNDRIPIGERITIYPRGKKKIYVADFWEGNAHRRRSLRTTNKKAAIQRATKLANDLIDGTLKPPPKPISIRQAIDDYLLFCRTRGKAPATIKKYKGNLTIFRDFLTGTNINQLARVTPIIFDRFVVERAAVCAGSTTHGSGVIIKSLFKWAMSRRLVSENPLIDIKLDKPVFEPKPAPSLNEVNALLDIASDSDRGPISILAFTGMRSGELRRLRPADIDIAGNWIHIHSRPDGKTKTKLSRKVPIHPRLLPVLRVAVQENRPYLFTAPRSSKYPAGDHWMNVRLLNDRFASLVTRMGLPAGRESGFVLHSLRHFFETFGVNAGIPQRVIDTWLGHRSDRSMAAVYYRLGDGESQLFMQKVPFGTGQPAAEAGKELVR